MSKIQTVLEKISKEGFDLKIHSYAGGEAGEQCLAVTTDIRPLTFGFLLAKYDTDEKITIVDVIYHQSDSIEGINIFYWPNVKFEDQKDTLMRTDEFFIGEYIEVEKNFHSVSLLEKWIDRILIVEDIKDFSGISTEAIGHSQWLIVKDVETGEFISKKFISGAFFKTYEFTRLS